MGVSSPIGVPIVDTLPDLSPRSPRSPLSPRSWREDDELDLLLCCSEGMPGLTNMYPQVKQTLFWVGQSVGPPSGPSLRHALEGQGF